MGLPAREGDGPSLPGFPQELSGQAYVMTADADKGSVRSPAVTFSVNRPSFIFVLRDLKGTSEGGGKVPEPARAPAGRHPGPPAAPPSPAWWGAGGPGRTAARAPAPRFGPARWGAGMRGGAAVPCPAP